MYYRNNCSERGRPIGYDAGPGILSLSFVPNLSTKCRDKWFKQKKKEEKTSNKLFTCVTVQRKWENKRI